MSNHEVLIAKLKMMDYRFKIAYLIPHIDTDFSDTSELGWYGKGMLNTIELINFAVQMPADIREPFTEREYVLIPRISRNISSNIIPLELSSFEEAYNFFNFNFRVVLTNTPEMADFVDSIIRSSNVSCLHVSTENGINRIDIKKATRLTFIKSMQDMINGFCNANPGGELFSYMKTLAVSKKITKDIVIKYASGCHNVVLPNEIALSSYGYVSTKEDRLLAFPGAENRYILKVLETIRVVDEIRLKNLKNAPRTIINYKYVIAVPSVYLGFYKGFFKEVTKDQVSKSSKKMLKTVLRGIRTPGSYFDVFQPNDVIDIIENKEMQYIMHIRSQHMRAFTVGLTALSVATLAPVMRLEPKINNIRLELAQFGNTVREGTGTHYKFKQSKMLYILMNKMKILVDYKFIRVIERLSEVQKKLRLLNWFLICRLNYYL